MPLPTPRPSTQSTGSIAPRAASPAIPPQALAARAQAPAGQAPGGQPPSPISNPFAALLGQSGPALSPEQKALIDRVNGYLSAMQVLSGKFVQVGPDGSRTQGMFYISKPGKVRFEYDDPSPIELVADGESVVVRDRRLATQDVYPLSQTPLRFLLSDHVDLMKDSTLTRSTPTTCSSRSLSRKRTAIVGTSRLMIMFSAKDMQLKQWTVTDPQGLRHHRRGLQSGQQPASRSEHVQDRLHALSELSGRAVPICPQPALALSSSTSAMPSVI